MLEPSEHGRWREQLDPGGGQLDGQWQSVKASADLRHDPSVLLLDGEVWIDAGRPLGEQGDGLVFV